MPVDSGWTNDSRLTSKILTYNHNICSVNIFSRIKYHSGFTQTLASKFFHTLALLLLTRCVILNSAWPLTPKKT